jgi:tRNA(His) guanylyltransferase
MELSKRMKTYEGCYKTIITPRSYIIIRLDGKNFSKYTKDLVKPFDESLSHAMNETAIALCKEFNAKFAYTQSDEISILITDISDNPESQPILGNVLQKLCSLTASVATAKFNEIRNMQYLMDLDKELIKESIDGDFVIDFPKQAFFDARVFVVPNADEVVNHMVWRQQDSTKNSISMAAHALLGHKATMNLSGEQKQEMMFQEKGVNWNDYPTKFKRGVIISKKTILKQAYNLVGVNSIGNDLTVERTKWMVDYETPIFTKDKQYLFDLIPIN